MSIGIFVARYLKQYYWWFHLHIVVQVLSLSCAFIGFVLALIMTPTGRHFSNIHSWFGLTVLCLSCLAPALGIAADCVYDPGRSSPPFWPDRLHWWIGRTTVVVAYVAIILGINQIGGPPALCWTFLLLPGCYGALIAFLEVTKWWVARTNNASPKEDHDYSSLKESSLDH